MSDSAMAQEVNASLHIPPDRHTSLDYSQSHRIAYLGFCSALAASDHLISRPS